MAASLSVVIPVFRETENLPRLAEQIDAVIEQDPTIREVVWVDNGNDDAGQSAVLRLIDTYGWARRVCLLVNQGYGGGIYHGARGISPASTHIGWMPADGQISASDLGAVWTQVQYAPQRVHKGHRIHRADAWGARFVSRAYSLFTAATLGLTTRDTNGLPKIVPWGVWQSALDPLPPEHHGFSFDAYVLFRAKQMGVPITEHPVGWYQRQTGQSSWSNRKILTYCQVACACLRAAGPSTRLFSWNR